jgi:hypothetical protein
MNKPKQEIESGNWFADLILSFSPDSPTVDGTPEDMIKTASRKAFLVSTAAGVVPGPWGWTTILPEIIAVTKIQIDLIHSIAAYYKKHAQLTPSLTLLIFAGQVKIQIGKNVARNTAGKFIVREMTKKTARHVAQRVGAAIGVKITARALGRMIPFVLAPVFGLMSKSMTTDIGNEAIKIFNQNLEIIKIKKCINGHETDEDLSICTECQSPLH